MFLLRIKAHNRTLEFVIMKYEAALRHLYCIKLTRGQYEAVMLLFGN